MDGRAVFGGGFEERKGVGAWCKRLSGVMKGEWSWLSNVGSVRGQCSLCDLSVACVFKLPLKGVFKDDSGTRYMKWICELCIHEI